MISKFAQNYANHSIHILQMHFAPRAPLEQTAGEKKMLRSQEILHAPLDVQTNHHTQIKMAQRDSIRDECTNNNKIYYL